MNLDDRHHSILRRNYWGLNTRRGPSSTSFNSDLAKKSKGESKANRRVPTSSSSSSVSFNWFQSTRGGRSGPSSSFRKGHAKQGK